jgi:hypothetical protein
LASTIHGSQPVGMFAYDHKTHETSNVQKTSMMMTMMMMMLMI